VSPCCQKRCLQDKAGGFSLHDALCDALVKDNDELVELFMERVDMKTFLSTERLYHLYFEVGLSQVGQQPELLNWCCGT